LAVYDELKGEYSSLRNEFALLEERNGALQSQVDSLNHDNALLESRLHDMGDNLETLRKEKSNLMLEHERLLDKQDRASTERDTLELRTKQGMDSLAREKAEAVAQKESLDRTVASLKDEGDKLKRKVQDLLKESSVKDLRIVNLEKSRDQEIEDKEGLNLALESKQQELELVCCHASSTR
jgi:chromosome segregation ATPase